MKRRSFLGILAAALGLTAFGSVAYPLLRYLAPPAKTTGDGSKVFKKSDVGDSKEFLLRDTPVILINRPGKGYIALSRVCTHLGCLIDYDRDKKKLICPCHAGVYDLEGRVISGPPPKPLTSFPLRVEGEEIIIG